MMQQAEVPVGELRGGRNPRSYFDPKEMAELEESVRAKGVIQPITVRPIDGGYEVIAGERRWRAAKAVFGASYLMPVVVRVVDDAEAEELALIENVQRADMSPTEEAEAAAKVLGRCQGDHDEAARRLGWSRPTLDKRLALMNCSETVRKALSERRIGLGVAELLAAVTADKQDSVIGKILAMSAPIKVADLRAQLEKIARALGGAIFDKTECAGCHHNSSNQQQLFGEAIATGNCTNGVCFDAKTETALEAKKAELADDYPTIKIIRVGEAQTFLKVEGEGAVGVGDEQAKACRACKNFGAAISAEPGSIGNIVRDLCFDVSCNATMVAARIKAEKSAAGTTSAPKGKKTDGKEAKAAPSQKAGGSKTPKKETKVQDSQRVKDYRVGVWRQALRQELMGNHEKNLVVLIALCLASNAKHISEAKLGKAFSALTKQEQPSFTVNVAGALEAVAGTTDAVRARMLQALAASATEGIDERVVVQLLRFLKVDLSVRWSLSEEFLSLLTKSEIEALCDEIGLRTHMGTLFNKVLTSKKDEMVKALLKQEGFAYQGKVPRSIQLPTD